MPKQFIQRDPRVGAAAKSLHAYMQEHSLTQNALSEACGISQPQISKLLRGKAKKITRDLKKLCKYANIRIDTPTPPYNDLRIRSAIDSVWDGEDSTVDLVARLIKCVADVRRPL
jgi:transcriptional regulator with XRE-family HTH domain